MLHRTPLAGGVPLTPTLLAEREAVVDIIAAAVRHDGRSRRGSSGSSSGAVSHRGRSAATLSELRAG